MPKDTGKIFRILAEVPQSSSALKVNDGNVSVLFVDESANVIGSMAGRVVSIEPAATDAGASQVLKIDVEANIMEAILNSAENPQVGDRSTPLGTTLNGASVALGQVVVELSGGLCR